MTNDPIYLFQPVFDFLDGLIRDQGDRLYLVFFYLCLGVMGWILGGGLRSKVSRQPRVTAISFLVIRPPAEPPPLPPMMGEGSERGHGPTDDDDSSAFPA